MRCIGWMAAALAVLAAAGTGCTTFALHEQSGPLPLAKQRRASEATLAVLPFPYAPEDPKDASDLTPDDLLRWQELLAGGLDQTNVFAKVEVAPEGAAPPANGYLLGGRIRAFRFQKNWVPTFFPIHLALSFFTFSGYTLFGGPTTATIVRFAASFELSDAASNERLAGFDESFRSTRAVNVYSKGAENPYDNPNLVFARVVESVAQKLATALP